MLQYAEPVSCPSSALVREGLMARQAKMIQGKTVERWGCEERRHCLEPGGVGPRPDAYEAPATAREIRLPVRPRSKAVELVLERAEVHSSSKVRFMKSTGERSPEMRR